MATDTLKETQARIKRQMEYNISRRHEPGAEEAMTRGIGQSDYRIKKELGDLGVSMVAKMVESVPLSVSDPNKLERFDILHEAETQFSFRNLWDFCSEAEDTGKLKESSAETMYAALLRLGVNNIIAKAWKLVPVIWDQILMTNQVKGLFGVYGATFRPNMPKFVGAGEEFPELNVQPMGSILQNGKWGSMLNFQNEAIDDDMTGELSTKASEAGEDISIFQELNFAAYLMDVGSTGITEGDLTVTSATYTDPDTTTGVYATSGARQNAPSSYGVVGMNTIDAGIRIMKLIQQPNGRKILSAPDSLIYHPIDTQKVTYLLKSPVWPGSYNAGDSTGNQGGTQTGSPGGPNPLLTYGLTPYECRFLNFKTTGNLGAWYLCKRKSRSLIYQNRDGLQTLQESPSAGKSFDMDLSRWRLRQRGQWGWILGGARFFFQGNNGS